MTDHSAAAFDAFCVAQYPQLLGAVSLLCGDRGVAEELVQMALERTWARWDRVSRMDSPGGWTQQVAFNLARSHFRRRRAERRALARHGPDGPTDPVDTPVVVSVRAALDGLSSRHREVLLHRFYMGRNVAETAQVMDLSVAATKQLSYRARRAMKDAFEDRTDQPDPLTPRLEPGEHRG